MLFDAITFSFRFMSDITDSLGHKIKAEKRDRGGGVMTCGTVPRPGLEPTPLRSFTCIDVTSEETLLPMLARTGGDQPDCS